MAASWSRRFTRCCGTQFTNLSIEAFDPAAFDANAQPWSVLVTHDKAPPRPARRSRTTARVLAAGPVPQQAASGVVDSSR
jgi:hypothetical protein